MLPVRELPVFVIVLPRPDELPMVELLPMVEFEL
jgi:hypothetical protein